MWVTKAFLFSASFFFLMDLKTKAFTHNLFHTFFSLNSPLTRDFSLYPQDYLLATTTTYKYINTPVRFHFLTIKDLQTIDSERRLRK